MTKPVCEHVTVRWGVDDEEDDDEDDEYTNTSSHAGQTSMPTPPPRSPPSAHSYDDTARGSQWDAAALGNRLARVPGKAGPLDHWQASLETEGGNMLLVFLRCFL